MAAGNVYFSRDVKVYVVQDSGIGWEIPILDGYSFTQSMNTSEVTLSEMTLSSGASRRGRTMFNESLSGTEWSFSTYARPFAAQNATDQWEPAGATVDNIVHAVEEPLLANMMGNPIFAKGTSPASSTWDEAVTNADTGTGTVFDFLDSDKPALGTFTLYFVFDENGTTPQVYKINESVVSSASIDFDIEGITTWSFSGMGKKIEDLKEDLTWKPTLVITEGVVNDSGTAITNNFIRNRLTEMTVLASDTTTFPGDVDGGNAGQYSIPLTGGSFNIENNISFLTPASLGLVNQPLEHVTGARTVGGSFTAYLGVDNTGTGQTGTSAQFFRDLAAASNVTTNSFEVTFTIGGSGEDFRIAANFPQVHFEVPQVSVEDVISMEANFSALPSTLDTPDEATLTYHGIAPSA